MLTKILDQQTHAKTTERRKGMTSRFNLLKLTKDQIKIGELTVKHIEDCNGIIFEYLNTGVNVG